MNPFKDNITHATRHLALALLAGFLLASCGGGGGGSGTPSSADSNFGTSQVALVEVSSAGSSSIDVSWLPAVDSTTLASAMKYQVHASTDLTYIPSSATLKVKGTGILSARLTGLQAATRYTVILVAINAAGNSTVSSPLSVTTSALNNETIPGVVVATPTDVQIAAVTGNQVTLTADAAAPQVGQFIASTQGDGFLRQVTEVSTISGQTVVQTQPASLNQVANNVEISSSFVLTSVPATVAPTQAGVIVKSLSEQKGAAEWQWPQTNFRLSSAPVKRNAGNAQGTLQMGVAASGTDNIDVSTKTVSKVGSWATFTGPDTVGILAGTSGAVDLTLDVTKDDATWVSGTRIPTAICKVEVIDDGTSGLAVVSSLTPTETETVEGYSAIRHAKQLIAFNATGVAARAEPYTVVLRAYIDESGNHCQEEYRFFIGWKEKLDIAIRVAVVSTPNFPQSESAALDFTGAFSVHNDVTFTFDPKLEAEVKLHNAGHIIPTLDYARLETKSRAELAQKLTVTATGAGTIDKTKTLIGTRKFVKVYMAGTVPIVMSGEFSADLRIQGNVTGALIATEEVKFSLEDMTYGVIYDVGATPQWRTTQNVRPTYDLKLSGNGDAEAHLTLTLLPKLSIKFYEAASGRLIVSPYLQADAGVHGQVLADITPAGTTTDADYWLTQGKISGGVDAYLMADLTVWDYTLAKWPSTANIADYTTFKKIPLIPNSPVVIAGLPTLTATYDGTTKNPTDSRAYLIKGRAVDVANPFKSLFGGPDAFLPFANWTAPKVIALNNAGYTFVSSPAGSDPGDVWITFTMAGTYTVRLGGNSSMGGWARQVAEVNVVVTDSNNNGIIDQWETKYGLLGSGTVIAAADPDADGLTNLQEFQQGRNPTVADAAVPSSAPTQTVVITQVLDNYGPSTGPLMQGATTDDTTPGLSGNLSAALTSTQILGVFNGSTVLGTASVSGTTWSFTPTALAAGNYSFTATVVSVDGIEGIRSVAWNLIIADGGTAPDTTPPTVSSTSPANSATGVAVNAAITATFSETMTASTVTTATFTLDNGVTGAVTYNGTTATFTPSSNLAYSTAYTATITTAVKDAAGNPMAAAYTWTFTTGTATVPTAPTGISATAGNGQATISWNAVTGATSYNLYMASVSGVTKSNYSSLTDGMQHTGVTSPYTHTGLTNGTTYYFVVTAVDTNGESSESSQVTATPQVAPVVTSKLNDTGITASQCYQAGSNVLVACNSAGAIALNNAQDGMAGRDANTATNSNTDGKLGFSFASVPAAGSDPGGCVQDNITGLMWENKTTDGGLRDWSKTYTNYSATYDPNLQYGTVTDASGFVTAVNATNLCGYSDWRLPTADELQSIVDYSVAAPKPTIDTAWFFNTRDGFWSASSYAGLADSAWGISFSDGHLSGGNGRKYALYVQLVRAGRALATVRYTMSADGQEVTDNQTNLIWRRCAEGMNWDGNTCAGVASTFTHEAALQRAAAQASASGTAWRLPNVKELASIADKSRISPAIDPTVFPATPANFTWTASPNASASIGTWYVDFGDGYVGNGYGRGGSDYVRLVRAGQ